MEASYIDLADPTHLEFDYLRWIRIVLEVAGARRVLHIGGGACALARALAAQDPGGRQEVCEADADVLELARAHMGLRRVPGLRVRHAEGRAFLTGPRAARWDAVVLDAFAGATVPRRLITAQAFAAVARAAPLALVNVVDNRSAREVRLVAAGLRRTTMTAQAQATAAITHQTPAARVTIAKLMIRVCAASTTISRHLSGARRTLVWMLCNSGTIAKVERNLLSAKEGVSLRRKYPEDEIRNSAVIDKVSEPTAKLSLKLPAEVQFTASADQYAV